MQDEKLIEQLHYLKRIKPDDYWKRESREILLSQISNLSALNLDEKTLAKNSYLINLKNFFLENKIFNWATQPVAVFVLIVLFLIGGGAISINASKNSLPGDSFYIAKIINEKARLTLTFNDEDKAKLGLEFASNRAKEITKLLADSAPSEENKNKVEQLTNNFKEEIKVVRNKIQNIKITRKVSNPPLADADKSGQKEENEKNKEVFGVNAEKGEKGIDISINKSGNTSLKLEVEAPKVITTTPSTTPVVTPDENTNVKLIDLNKAISDAENLFDLKDYSGTIDKLEEVHSIIENKDGEVKGESETAPSSSPVNN